MLKSKLMILSAIFSNPKEDTLSLFGKNYKKIRLIKNSSPSAKPKMQYQLEFFTETQAFQKNITKEEAETFVKTHTGKTFASCTIKTEEEEITVTQKKNGLPKVFRKKRDANNIAPISANNFNRTKNHFLREGEPLPFLISLGLMSREGKILSGKEGKFRQINRFLELVDDILGSVEKLSDTPFTENHPLRIIDFGCGKSYLTFALYYFISKIKKIPLRITGIDLKEDVLSQCTYLSKSLGFEGMTFCAEDVNAFDSEEKCDIVVSLHACDTATDSALKFAVRKKVASILAVPCCQHEIASQLGKKKVDERNPFSSLLQYGILRERLSSLVTDALRCESLEIAGYSVQALEFIDEDATAKNIMIRAIRKKASDATKEQAKERAENLLKTLGVEQTLFKD